MDEGAPSEAQKDDLTLNGSNGGDCAASRAGGHAPEAQSEERLQCQRCRQMEENIIDLKTFLGSTESWFKRYCDLKRESESLLNDLEERTRQRDQFRAHFAAANQMNNTLSAQAVSQQAQVSELQKKISSFTETVIRLRVEAETSRFVHEKDEEERHRLMMELKNKNDALSRLEKEAKESLERQKSLEKQVDGWQKKFGVCLALTKALGKILKQSGIFSQKQCDDLEKTAKSYSELPTENLLSRFLRDFVVPNFAMRQTSVQGVPVPTATEQTPFQYSSSAGPSLTLPATELCPSSLTAPAATRRNNRSAVPPSVPIIPQRSKMTSRGRREDQFHRPAVESVTASTSLKHRSLRPDVPSIEDLLEPTPPCSVTQRIAHSAAAAFGSGSRMPVSVSSLSAEEILQKIRMEWNCVRPLLTPVKETSCFQTAPKSPKKKPSTVQEEIPMEYITRKRMKPVRPGASVPKPPADEEKNENVEDSVRAVMNRLLLQVVSLPELKHPERSELLPADRPETGPTSEFVIAALSVTSTGPQTAETLNREPAKTPSSEEDEQFTSLCIEIPQELEAEDEMPTVEIDQAKENLPLPAATTTDPQAAETLDEEPLQMSSSEEDNEVVPLRIALPRESESCDESAVLAVVQEKETTSSLAATSSSQHMAETLEREPLQMSSSEEDEEVASLSIALPRELEAGDDSATVPVTQAKETTSLAASYSSQQTVEILDREALEMSSSEEDDDEELGELCIALPQESEEDDESATLSVAQEKETVSPMVVTSDDSQMAQTFDAKITYVPTIEEVEEESSLSIALPESSERKNEHFAVDNIQERWGISSPASDQKNLEILEQSPQAAVSPPAADGTTTSRFPAASEETVSAEKLVYRKRADRVRATPPSTGVGSSVSGDLSTSKVDESAERRTVSATPDSASKTTTAASVESRLTALRNRIRKKRTTAETLTLAEAEAGSDGWVRLGLRSEKRIKFDGGEEEPPAAVSVATPVISSPKTKRFRSAESHDIAEAGTVKRQEGTQNVTKAVERAGHNLLRPTVAARNSKEADEHSKRLTAAILKLKNGITASVTTGRTSAASLCAEAKNRAGNSITGATVVPATDTVPLTPRKTQSSRETGTAEGNVVPAVGANERHEKSSAGLKLGDEARKAVTSAAQSLAKGMDVSATAVVIPAVPMVKRKRGRPPKNRPPENVGAAPAFTAAAAKSDTTKASVRIFPTAGTTAVKEGSRPTACKQAEDKLPICCQKRPPPPKSIFSYVLSNIEKMYNRHERGGYLPVTVVNNMMRRITQITPAVISDAILTALNKSAVELTSAICCAAGRNQQGATPTVGKQLLLKNESLLLNMFDLLFEHRPEWKTAIYEEMLLEMRHRIVCMPALSLGQKETYCRTCAVLCERIDDSDTFQLLLWDVVTAHRSRKGDALEMLFSLMVCWPAAFRRFVLDQDTRVPLFFLAFCHLVAQRKALTQKLSAAVSNFCGYLLPEKPVNEETVALLRRFLAELFCTGSYEVRDVRDFKDAVLLDSTCSQCLERICGLVAYCHTEEVERLIFDHFVDPLLTWPSLNTADAESRGGTRYIVVTLLSSIYLVRVRPHFADRKWIQSVVDLVDGKGPFSNSDHVKNCCCQVLLYLVPWYPISCKLALQDWMNTHLDTMPVSMRGTVESLLETFNI